MSHPKPLNRHFRLYGYPQETRKTLLDKIDATSPLESPYKHFNRSDIESIEEALGYVEKNCMKKAIDTCNPYSFELCGHMGQDMAGAHYDLTPLGHVGRSVLGSEMMDPDNPWEEKGGTMMLDQGFRDVRDWTFAKEKKFFEKCGPPDACRTREKLLQAAIDFRIADVDMLEYRP